MNTKKFAKVFQALLSAGVPVAEATKTAARLSDKSEEPKVKRVHVNADSLRGQIIQYTDARKGNVWSLQQIARALGADPNSISAQITSLTKGGYIVRTGRGEYRKAH